MPSLSTRLDDPFSSTADTRDTGERWAPLRGGRVGGESENKAPPSHAPGPARMPCLSSSIQFELSVIA